MRPKNHIRVIIPAINEEESIGKVLGDIPDFVTEVIVIDNGSSDNTAINAQRAGAKVLLERQKGYGNACLRGLRYVAETYSPEETDIIVFLDADYSDHPEQMPELLQKIEEEKADLVIGSRALGHREKGSMTIPQRFGNVLATTLVRWIYGIHFTDLGPFRAIRYAKLLELDMKDKTFGWTVEMQVKAAKHGLRCAEVPVDYRRRIGVSKVSGTVKGTILAGYKILWTIATYTWKQ